MPLLTIPSSLRAASFFMYGYSPSLMLMAVVGSYVFCGLAAYGYAGPAK